MKVSSLSVVCFDDNNYEFINGSLKNDILYPSFAIKNEYNSLDELISELNANIIESKSKYITFVYGGSDLLDRVEFLNRNIMNHSAEILKRFKSSFDIELKDYLIDYSLYESENEYVAYICGIPKHFEELFHKIKNAKFISCFSDIYATSLFFTNENEISLKLNVRNNNTVLCITESNNILFTRGLNIGLKSIAQKIATDGGVSINSVFDYLADVGVDDYETEEKQAISTTIRDNIDRVSLEIQRTLDYYNRYISKGKVESINIIGKFNSIKSIEKYYNKLFNLKINKTIPENFIAESNHEFDDFDYLIEILGAFKEI
ncbi:hypothetical protein DEFDS_1251 [Deferribacter desulfuricans SSM1]|uniref:Uncharacterized protein n=1 Tax=Deferribacter desulfuricans (strain DSM 14783 / JCM 11476 / NBRC 101012 / SSM1) TaxID=639282 RepID=D3PDP6_DEFDS|nr:hypothetical protein [Deferribacter desulfuricans]BAI80719.1 hypothetical protein DEFDS_1251 [Deferribacter desulfuricans SSM1]